MNKGSATDDSTLLLTLEEVSRLVAHSHDPAETLDNIVCLIQERFGTAVCSVYVLDRFQSQLVLGATVGLSPEAIGRVRMNLDEGLTGLVAERVEPVMVPDAFAHPRFKYFPEAGEDPYRSFLGVPLVEGGALQGVLVVQTAEPRTFSAGEVRMLVTVAAQLAPLVGDARLIEQVAAATHPTSAPELPGPVPILSGLSLSAGVGVGQAYVVDGSKEWLGSLPQKGSDLESERQRLARAIERSEGELEQLSQKISRLVGEEHGAILHAQRMIMRDRTISQDLDACLQDGACAEAALINTMDNYVAAFQKLSTPFFQERVYDIKDVFHRILWQLRPREESGLADQVVLVAREASVMELFAVDLDRLAGVVVEHGGHDSHAAILARSLGIPMVGQVTEFPALMQSGRYLLVDGTAGTVTLDPPIDQGLPASPKSLADDQDKGPPRSGEPELSPELPRLEANINLLYELGPALQRGAEAVGLFRSEFLFLARRTIPTEDEQVGIYRKLLQQLAGRPVTIRTFDLRPDKLASYSYLGSVETRPYDWRLVLTSPPLQQLFRDQIRAILRAAIVGPVRILVPQVNTSELLDFVTATVAEARDRLRREGLEFSSGVPLGVMIESAAAVPLVRGWIDHASFFALGTNDLTATALGIDRDDPVAVNQADPLHPGLLRLIDCVVHDIHAANSISRDAGVPHTPWTVSVCGEMAADPLGAIVLAALGVDSLSVGVNQLSGTRRILASLSPSDLKTLRPLLLAQRTATAVRQELEDWRIRRCQGSNDKVTR